MIEYSCDKEKREMQKACEDWIAALMRQSIPPRHLTVDLIKAPLIITPELEESTMQENGEPELKKICLEKKEIWQNCLKNSRQ
jgi:hypothetical protein